MSRSRATMLSEKKAIEEKATMNIFRGNRIGKRKVQERRRALPLRLDLRSNGPRALAPTLLGQVPC